MWGECLAEAMLPVTAAVIITGSAICAIYVNPEVGAGTWPGIQSFGGWKGSGSVGRGARGSP